MAIAPKYAWQAWVENDSEVWCGLLPDGESNVHSLSRIASVYRRGDGRFVASYYYPHSTGNKQGDGGLFKSRTGAMRWLERQFDKFWEPPTILGATLYPPAP